MSTPAFHSLLRAHRRAGAAALSQLLEAAGEPTPAFFLHAWYAAFEFGASAEAADERPLPFALAHLLQEYRFHHGDPGETWVMEAEEALESWSDADEGNLPERLAAAREVVERSLPGGAEAEAACQVADVDAADPTVGFSTVVRSSREALNLGATLVGSLFRRLPGWLGADAASTIQRTQPVIRRDAQGILTGVVEALPRVWTETPDATRREPLLRLWGAAVPLTLLAVGPEFGPGRRSPPLPGDRDPAALATGVVHHALGEALTILRQLEGPGHALTPAMWASRMTR